MEQTTMSYEELKNSEKAQPLSVVSKVLYDNFEDFLQDIALNKQWKVAQELKMPSSQLSNVMTIIKAIKGL